MSQEAGLDTVERLRQEFDQGFSQVPAQAAEGLSGLLALSVGGDPYALRVDQVAGLAKDRRIALLPGGVAGLLGLAGIRGALMPIWDLGAVLGYPAARGKARWLALASGEPAWAAAFDGFEGYLSVSAEALHPYSAQGSVAAFCNTAALVQGQLRPLLDLAAIRRDIQKKHPSIPQRSLS